MTFFANAGVKWPKVQTELRKAGTSAMSGGAELWRLFSEIEAWESDHRAGSGEDGETKRKCVNALREAADRYEESLRYIDRELTGPLSSSEIDLVAPPFPYFINQLDPDPLRRTNFEVSEIYVQLIGRLRELASEINALDLGRDRRDLASEVFGAMRAWELISWLARLIVLSLIHI